MRRSDREEMCQRGPAVVMRGSGRDYACHQIIDSTSKNVRPKHKIKESRFDADINTLSCGTAVTWVTEWTHLKKGEKKNQISQKQKEMSLLTLIYFVKYNNFNSLKLIFPFHSSHGFHLSSTLSKKNGMSLK